MERTEQRRDKLRRQLRKAAPAMLVTEPTNVTYLTGFTGDSSFLLLMDRGQVLLTDGRYTTQLQEECPGLELVVRGPGQKMEQLVERVVKRAKLSKLAVEADAMTLALKGAIADRLPKVELVETSGLVERLRQVKDRQEVAAIRRAIDVAQRAFEAVRAWLRGDQTEQQVAFELEHRIRWFGGAGCSFPPIVASGPRAALPHARPEGRRIDQADLLLIDWGAEVGLYRSDLTRVLVTGRISPKLQRIYEVVLKAQRQAIAAIRPGALAEQVDAAARKVIEQAGFGRHFNHGLGHGIGLAVHEGPRLGPGEGQPLQAGMVVTVEPGVYLPGWGGVRIEDDVLVTRNGHEVLSQVAGALDQCLVPCSLLNQ